MLIILLTHNILLKSYFLLAFNFPNNRIQYMLNQKWRLARKSTRLYSSSTPISMKYHYQWVIKMDNTELPYDEDLMCYMEKQMTYLDKQRILKDIEETEPAELCNLLNIKDEQQFPAGDSLLVYRMMINDNSLLPDELRLKLFKHFDSCYLCGELYRNYKNYHIEMDTHLKSSCQIPVFIKDKLEAMKKNILAKLTNCNKSRLN